jgi:hypothetical protein
MNEVKMVFFRRILELQIILFAFIIAIIIPGEFPSASEYTVGGTI